MGDTTDRTLAEYLLDGLSVNSHAVTATTLGCKDGLYSAKVQVDDSEWVEGSSRLSWFTAAESVVRQVLWRLASEESGDD